MCDTVGIAGKKMEYKKKKRKNYDINDFNVYKSSIIIKEVYPCVLIDFAIYVLCLPLAKRNVICISFY